MGCDHNRPIHPGNKQYNQVLYLILGILIFLKCLKRNVCPVPEPPSPCPPPASPPCFPNPPALRSIPVGPGESVTLNNISQTLDNGISSLGSAGGTILIDGKVFGPYNPIDSASSPIDTAFIRITSLDPAFPAVILNLSGSNTLEFIGNSTPGEQQVVVLDNIQVWQNE